MRLPLLLFGVWCALLLLAGAAARNAADTAWASSARDSAHGRFAAIPMEEFTRDRANRMAGRVLDESGRPVGGAEILIFDAQSCLDAARLAEAGAWPAPQPERTAHSDAAGDYACEGLSYGEKLVVARGAGMRSDFLPQLYFADGYGAPDTDFVLRRGPAPRIRLLRADGEIAAGERLRLLPRVFGLESREIVSDADGWLTLPTELTCPSGLPRALWGEPPVLLELPADGESLSLPACSLLRVEIPQGNGEEIELSLAPLGAGRVGLLRTRLAAGVARIEFPRAPLGSWVLMAVQGERIASRNLLPGEREAVLPLAPRRALTLLARGEDGEPLPAEFLVQTRAPLEPPVFSSDPLVWLEHHDASALFLASGADGTAQTAAPFAGAGWVIAFADHHAPKAQSVAPGANRVEIQLVHAHEVIVRTDRPYLPVLVEATGSPPAFGRTDAAGEAFAFAAEGPFTARVGVARGGASLPRGSLVRESADPALRFSALDEPGSPRGGVHGFVLTPRGEPCAELMVWIQGADGRPKSATTDAHGWYRFTQLDAGFYLGFADSQEADALWQQESLIVPQAADGAGVARLDLILHEGVIELAAETHGLSAGTRVSLRDREGGLIWETVIPESRRLRLSRVPDGQFRLVEQVGEELRVLGSLSVDAARGTTRVLEPEQ